ncbi:uncharacterized protein LOC115099791 [Rhinatrema bivittatum]|uniref:uncharacterized protein LOC115099791 n=1 Tax=Rhinatrema bivittatum TaxID=194408 RepID=UPI001127551C|nr:uncharacterized protein LOC115099791 [Rhinatrema bivittatum]
MTEHFSEVFDKHTCTKPGMIQRCAYRWPSLCVNWPPKGTFDFVTASRVRIVVTKEDQPGFPEDIPYINAWIEVILNPPSWAQKLVEGAALIMVAQMQKAGHRKSPNRKRKEKSAILDADGMTSPEAAILVVQKDEETTEKKIKPLPAAETILIDKPEVLAPPPYIPLYPPLLNLPPIPSYEQAEPLPSTSQETKRELESVRAEDEPEPPVSAHTRRRTQAAASLQLPIRETATVVPAVPSEENAFQTAQTIRLYTYVPFSSSDLFNWKQLGPSYAEKPDQMIDFLNGIFSSHNPNWADIRHLASFLFTTEQRRQIQQNMDEAARSGAGSDGDPDAAARELAPTTDPHWDYQTSSGRDRIAAYQRAFLEALRKGKRKIMNMTKIQDIVQKKDETPGDFLERLMDAYRRYSPFDPEDQKNHPIIVMSFVGQSCPDIRRKIQKTEGFEGMNISQLKIMADKVYGNRELEDEKKEKKESSRRMRESVNLLAAAMEETNFGEQARKYRGYPGQRGRGNPPQKAWQRGRSGRGGSFRGGRAPIGVNQCAYCKQEGHWKADCPEKPREDEGGNGSKPSKSQETEWQMALDELSDESSDDIGRNS